MGMYKVTCGDIEIKKELLRVRQYKGGRGDGKEVEERQQKQILAD